MSSPSPYFGNSIPNCILKKKAARIFHAPGYPVSNALVAAFILFIFFIFFIFFSAFALPDQRSSFFLGLGLILAMSLVYWVVRKRLFPEPK